MEPRAANAICCDSQHIYVTTYNEPQHLHVYSWQAQHLLSLPLAHLGVTGFPCAIGRMENRTIAIIDYKPWEVYFFSVE